MHGLINLFKKSKELHRTRNVSKASYLDCGDLGIISGITVTHKEKTNRHEMRKLNTKKT